MERLLLIGALAFAAGCTCAHEEAVEAPTLAPDLRPAPPPREESWPEAVIELSARPPATRFTVRPSTVELDNRALVASWPAAAVERARASLEDADAPRLRETVPLDDDAALGDALRRARGIERAATGAGGGAGICDLRVAADVAFNDFERVLRAAGLAGYHAPRLLLGEDDALVAFEWPRARSSGPTQDEIEAAFEAMRRGEEPTLADPGSTDARLRLTAAGARVWLGEERRCEEGVSLATVEACLRGLLATGVVLEVDGEMPFGEVAPWVQRASRASDGLSVRSTTRSPGSSR
ncbi:MAG: hypothetical protein KC619_13835 [Myxococcales bacterium]|nr:hypothetical protein [Myxococcales bacterium]